MHRTPISIALMIATVCLLAPMGVQAAPRGTIAKQQGLHLDGTFIQYQGWMKTMNTAAWRRELDAMRRAHIHTIFIQWLQNNMESYLPADAHAPDATGIILNYADQHGMAVYVGLATDDAWWTQALDLGYQQQAASLNISLAKHAWARYGHHHSFAGWYLPQELSGGGFSGAQIDQVALFFRKISSACKSLSPGKPVSTSCFFETTQTPEAVGKSYERFLKSAGIDILLAQDGVGAEARDNDIDSVVPYFRALRDACLTNGVALWSDLECFHRVTSTPLKFVPADAPRIGRQLAAETPFVRHVVTFDFFHYMSPYRGSAQRALYSQYMHDFIDRPFFPTEGASIELDPGFPYYQGRTPRSIAEEIRAHGYSVVEYVVTADSNINAKLISALHDAGIGVWYLTFGNGTYSTIDLPKGWTTWKMVTRSDLEGKPTNDGFTRLCLNNSAYRSWKKAQIVHALRTYPFDGVQIAEPYWPDYPGPSSEVYSCFCPACHAAFHKMSPEETAFPDIIHSESPLSPEKNPALWQKWLTFRTAGVTDFLNDLVNGPGGIRASVPKAKVSTWIIALTGPDGMQQVRESMGVDPADVARVVNPDQMAIEADWPDWIRPDLAPDYVKDYAPVVQAVHAVRPAMSMLIQADIGSQRQDRQSDAWIDSFRRACGQLGMTSTTLYEYHLGLAMYKTPPHVVECRRHGNTVELIFDQRLDQKIASDMRHYHLTSGHIRSAVVDGNLVTLRTAGQGALTIRGIANQPKDLIFPEGLATILQSQTIALPRRQDALL